MQSQQGKSDVQRTYTGAKKFRKRGRRHQQGTMSRQLEDDAIVPSVKSKERQENL